MELDRICSEDPTLESSYVNSKYILYIFIAEFDTDLS
jgi:hypothetical protein